MNEMTSEASIEKLKLGILRSQIRDLDISFNSIGNGGVKLIAQALSQTSMLESLNISSCGFTAKGGHSLFQVLARNARLRQLIVDRNYLDGKRLRVLRDFF